MAAHIQRVHAELAVDVAGEFAALGEELEQHRALFWLWAVLYTFVGIQMGWTLRPFVGSPEWFPTFVRQEPFTNAYVEVWAILQRAMGVR